MGGSITTTSVIGKGSTFVFHLQLPEEPPYQDVCGGWHDSAQIVIFPPEGVSTSYLVDHDTAHVKHG